MSLLKRAIFLTAIFLFSASVASRAQNLSLSTNFVDWGFFGTANLTFESAFSKHFSMEVGAKYNPWTFKKNSDRPIMNQQITGFVSAKYWFWYVYSGWWMSAKAKYNDYTQTGLIRYSLDEGKSVGAGLAFGYSYMLGKHFNIDLSLGLWGGRTFDYVSYDSAARKKVLKSGNKWFLGPDNIEVALKYVF